jgi:hypothetical protein
MKLCRHGKDGLEKPGMIDAQGKLLNVTGAEAPLRDGLWEGAVPAAPRGTQKPSSRGSHSDSPGM